MRLLDGARAADDRREASLLELPSLGREGGDVLVRNFEGDPFLAWSFQHNKSDDAWLRYRALWAAGRNEKMDIVLERARTEKDIWLRAAAVEAAAAWKDAALLDLLRHIHKLYPFR